MTAYYNEHDPFAAAWLRQLVDAGHIAPGIVDERSIEDVLPDELAGFTQCHFFAGIGVWSHALRRAGWPDDRPVWTGSCPCQPFSAAGKGAGISDERHLWPAFHHLIDQCRPPVVFGEQVASRDGLAWLDLVHADMEGTGYAFGSADLCAAGFGAPHIRQRLFFVADTDRARLGTRRKGQPTVGYGQTVESDSGHGGLGNALGCRWTKSGLPVARSVSEDAGGENDQRSDASKVGGLADPEQHGYRCQGDPADHWKQEAVGPADRTGGCSCASSESADADEQHGDNRRCGSSDARRQQFGTAELSGSKSIVHRTGPTNGHWRSADWLHCRDGKWRPVEPGTQPLAHGTPNRVGRLRAILEGMGYDAKEILGMLRRPRNLLALASKSRIGRLRGYGNAIVAPVAEAWIRAYL